MKDGEELLSILVNTMRLARKKIQTILKSPLAFSIRTELITLIQAYETIEQECLSFAAVRGWILDIPNWYVTFATILRLRIRFYFPTGKSRTAQIVIQECTADTIYLVKTHNRLGLCDSRINILAQKFLDCNNQCIQQMQGFL